MKCAGGGDGKYELSGAPLVRVIKMSALESSAGKLIVDFWARNTSRHKYVLFIYCF